MIMLKDIFDLLESLDHPGMMISIRITTKDQGCVELRVDCSEMVLIQYVHSIDQLWDGIGTLRMVIAEMVGGMVTAYAENQPCDETPAPKDADPTGLASDATLPGPE